MKKLALLTGLLLPLTAPAALLLTEPFTYPDGAVVSAPATLWANYSGAVGQMMVVSNQLKVVLADAEGINTILPGQPYDTVNNPGIGFLYASMKLNFTSLPSVSSGGNYFALFKGSGASNYRCRLFAARTNAAAGCYRLSIGSTNSMGTNTASVLQYPMDLATNTAYTVVMRLNLATGGSTLWVNPTAETSASVSSTADPGTPSTVTSFAFRQGGGAGVVMVDDLKIGAAFNDVAGNNTPPTITSIPNQNTPAGTATAPIAVVVGDAETPAANLTLTASSSNPSLVPNANIVFGGSGADRTVTITPASGQQGSATITLSVKDADNNTSSTSFVLIVGAPSISEIPDQNFPVGTSLPAIPFTISDTESPAGSLAVSVSSSNTGLIPNGGIVFGGSGGNRTILMTPVGGATGVTTITVSVSDGINTVSNQFMVAINPLFGILFSDGFPTNGPIAGPGTLWSHSSGTSNQMQVVGGQAMVTYTNTEDVSVTLNNSPFYPSNGVVLYCAFTLKCVDLPSPLGNYFFYFKDASSAFKGKVFCCATNAAPGCFRLGVANAANNASAIVNRDLATNTAYAVVLRYNVASAVSTLWVNPVLEADASVTATDYTAPSTVTAIALREDTYEGTLLLDDLKVGTAWADVVAAVPTFKLSVLSGSSPQISWPTAATGCVLQSSSDLINWQTATQSPAVVGDQNVLTVTPTGKMQFFRLKQ